MEEAPKPDIGLSREFKETPRGFVSVFTAVPRETVDGIAAQGLKVEFNQAQKKSQIEEMLEQQAKLQGIKVSRLRCLFAYPRNPQYITSRLTFDPGRELLIEALVDPNSALVADHEYFTEASERLSRYSAGNAQPWIESYWKNSKPLSVYLSENHTGDEEDYDDFNFPEVLIPGDIPPSRLRVASLQPRK